MYTKYTVDITYSHNYAQCMSFLWVSIHKNTIHTLPNVYCKYPTYELIVMHALWL